MGKCINLLDLGLETIGMLLVITSSFRRSPIGARWEASVEIVDSDMLDMLMEAGSSRSDNAIWASLGDPLASCSNMCCVTGRELGDFVARAAIRASMEGSSVDEVGVDAAVLLDSRACP